MPRPRIAALGVVVAVLLLLTSGYALAHHQDNLPILQRQESHAHTGSMTTITDSLVSYSQTQRLTYADVGAIFDRTTVTCHGGRAHVIWHVGNLEPTVPRTGIHLSAYMDGERIGTLLAGSTDGIYNDDPAEIHAVVDCPAGEHEFYVRVDNVSTPGGIGGWGLPYSHHDYAVNRGFIVTEIW